MEEVKFKLIEPSEIGEQYWARLADRVLPFIRCTGCSTPRIYLTKVCAACESTDFDWVESAGHGNIYACTTVHYPPTNEFVTPYVVGLVDLDEGYRVMANIVNGAELEPQIGDRVHVTFEELPDGKLLPQFELEHQTPRDS
jgi:uncharacterized OB-fold protein